MNDFDCLIYRYLEDRAGLTPDELDELIAGLRADPELAASLRDQLLLDDLLAQKLAVDRRKFVAQVEQRIADLARGPAALDEQVADLRSLAAAEKSCPPAAQVPGWTRWALAVAALLAVTVGVYAARSLTAHPPTIAMITEVTGPVTIGQDGDTSPAEVDDALESGQQIVASPGGSISIVYEDGTSIRVKGNSAVTFGVEQPGEGKQIRIERGEIVATVKPQVAGPFRFATPHGVATAPPALLRLVVTDESTLLDVSEGRVRFDRLNDTRALVVAANESGLASRDTLQIRQLTWPDRRDGLSYLFSPLEPTAKDNKPLMVARHPDTRHLRLTELEPRGNATLLESRLYYELNGGYLFSGAAGPDIFQASRGGSELTLEAIFCPASLDQAGPARILALGDDSNDADFSLAQDGCDVTFSLRTDTKPTTAAPRMPISTADTTLHLTMTYRHGELIAYRDGMEIARSNDLLGSLASWRSGPLTVGADASGEHPWRGIMEAFALYNRCLEPGEVARNARNYRLLAGRGM
jgi:Concanavalin A-like lectin/glucanases superfamily/FecR protein